MQVELTRLRKNGRGVYVVFTVPLQEYTGWRVGDRIAVRPVGDKLLMERIRMEDLAKLKAGEGTDVQQPT